MTGAESLDIAIKQYEEAIAFEVANPWDGSLTPRSHPYCYIPDKVKARIEDGRADYLTEVKKLLASCKRARKELQA